MIVFHIGVDELFVDAIYDKHKDVIKVAERVDGERILKEYPAEHVFYYEHPSGSHRTIFGDSCRKYSTNSNKKFRKELMQTAATKRVFESDINPVFRALADHYRGADAPTLNVAFFDIEVAFDSEQGYAPVDDPFNPITAISVYCTWAKTLIGLALCPPTMTLEQAREAVADHPNTFVFDDEKELIRTFLDIIQDADCISGWNSTFFDIPYIVNRITRMMSADDTRELCLWGQRPRPRTIMKFKREHGSYDLVGRVHLDYMELYQKHNTQQLHSYRLDYVGEIEVGETKVPYEGNLDDLWKKDFRRFVEYSLQDTMLLPKIDSKKKFIELANQIAHANCVQLKTTMGSVSLVETAIINEMHDLGFIVPDRKKRVERPHDEDDVEEDRTPVVGAYVADPKQGLHEHVGAVDINSLYPSVLRSLNMSPETIYGQFRLDETNEYIAKKVVELGEQRRAEAWEGVFHCFEYGHIMAQDGAPLTVDFEDGRTRTMSGRDWYEYIFDPSNHVCVTANGTLFRTDKEGIIPTLLGKWYAQRKEMQAQEQYFTDLEAGIEIDEEMVELLKI